MLYISQQALAKRPIVSSTVSWRTAITFCASFWSLDKNKYVSTTTARTRFYRNPTLLTILLVTRWSEGGLNPTSQGAHNLSDKSETRGHWCCDDWCEVRSHLPYKTCWILNMSMYGWIKLFFSRKSTGICSFAEVTKEVQLQFACLVRCPPILQTGKVIEHTQTHKSFNSLKSCALLWMQRNARNSCIIFFLVMVKYSPD